MCVCVCVSLTVYGLIDSGIMSKSVRVINGVYPYGVYPYMRQT